MSGYYDSIRSDPNESVLTDDGGGDNKDGGNKSGCFSVILVVIVVGVALALA